MSRFLFFFFNDTATTEIYTLSLHDALPISEVLRTHLLTHPYSGGHRFTAGEVERVLEWCRHVWRKGSQHPLAPSTARDRKSTRLNSSHANISYAVFCLKKKNNIISE